MCVLLFFFFQAEEGIRVFCLSRGLGDVFKGQEERSLHFFYEFEFVVDDVVKKKRGEGGGGGKTRPVDVVGGCIR